MTYRAFNPAVDEGGTPNPFVPISDMARVLVLVYFLLWRILPAVASLELQSIPLLGQTSVIAVLACLTELFILLPFLMKRFAGSPIGWLHPLILPTLVSIALGILTNPASLLSPVFFWSQSAVSEDHILLSGWDQSSILSAQIRANFINLLALLFTYLGFSLVRPASSFSVTSPLRISGIQLGLFFLLFLLVVLFFIHSQGGILAHMSTLGGGRFRMRELSGHFLVINNFLPYMILLWYAYRPSALRNIVFILGFAIAVVLQFIVTGSRTGLLMPVAMLLAVWMFHNRRVPATRAMAAGLAAVLLLGVLGDVRRSGRDGDINFSSLMQFNLVEAWEASQREVQSRSNGTDLAIAGLVPEQRSFLLGTTYVAALGFWVPRSIWEDKPRGAGAHAAALLYRGRDTMEGYSGGGYPVGGASEAYWNFWYPGVAVIFTLFGAILHVVSRWLCREPRNPFALVSLLIVNFGLSSPSTVSIVTALQVFVLLFLLYICLCRLRVRI